MSRLLLVLLLLAPLGVHAAPAEDQWFTVLLDGRKIGRFHNLREVRDDRVVTTQQLDLELDRAGTRVAMSSTETSEETLAGEPIAFTNASHLTGNEARIEGRVANGRVSVRIRNADEWQEREMAWPDGALLPEGLRLAGLDTPLTKGASDRQLSFMSSSLSAIAITRTIGATETVSLASGRTRLHRVEQAFEFPGTGIVSTAWIDDERRIRKLSTPMLGVELVMLECDEACANAPNQSSDVFERTLVHVPRTLGREELGRGLRYMLKPRDRGAPLSLGDTAEQTVKRKGSQLVVDVHRDARAGFGKPPEAADRAANDWLQSDAPEVVALARKATDGVEGDAARMLALESFVRGYITDKSLGVGYASALEVVRDPRGDCTEHAVLLAALGRSVGIATRVVDGLAYTPGFAGQKNVFVPHAWVQAWTGDRWRSYDAALAGFDAGHIAFSAGDGDPWRFYQALDMLGRIEIRHVEALPADASH
ncbi:transglutaminase-like domain-containing protein [Dokdonella sp. MW10]|uniref:transglutaminase-like domain-containing protein n=1 Tax=Dokdonella sp. MW10 TaxID=2992926 RepID=UPI003F8046F4